MAVVAAASLGKKLEWHNGTAFEEILGLTEINVDYGSRTLIETSDLATALTAPQPVVAGLRGPVSITATGKWDKNDLVHARLLSEFKAGGPARQVKYTRSDATPSTATWATAIIESLSEPGGTKDSLATFSITIRAFGTETEA